MTEHKCLKCGGWARKESVWRGGIQEQWYRCQSCGFTLPAIKEGESQRIKKGKRK